MIDRIDSSLPTFEVTVPRDERRDERRPALPLVAAQGHEAVHGARLELTAALEATSTRAPTAALVAPEEASKERAAESGGASAAPPRQLEAQFDEYMERAVAQGRLSEAEADAMTDQIASKPNIAARCEAMRRIMKGEIGEIGLKGGQGGGENEPNRSEGGARDDDGARHGERGDGHRGGRFT
jgi:hypothetical protein